MSRAVKMTRLGTREKLEARLAELGLSLPIDDEIEEEGPLSHAFDVGGRSVGNRFAVLPMEGWDASPDGRPTDLVKRRWSRFGESGAKLVWGGEAYAVQPEARANPQQLCANPRSAEDLASLRKTLVLAHKAKGDRTEDLLLGLQLTHSGRFSRPHGELLPRTAFRHSVLDRRVGVEDDRAMLTDDELDGLIGDYVRMAKLTEAAGFDFVDVKACHSGTNPLWQACARGLEAVAMRLLDRGGVDVDATNSQTGTTPLYWACAQRLGAVALRLLDIGGVDVDATDSRNGTTPLWWACHNGLGEVALRLLGDGVIDPDAKHRDGTTPLFWACEQGLGAVSLELLDGGGVDTRAEHSTHCRSLVDWAHANSLDLVAARIVAIQQSTTPEAMTVIGRRLVVGRRLDALDSESLVSGARKPAGHDSARASLLEGDGLADPRDVDAATRFEGSQDPQVVPQLL